MPKVTEGKPRLPVRVEEDLSLVRRLSIDPKDNKVRNSVLKMIDHS